MACHELQNSIKMENRKCGNVDGVPAKYGNM
jgi:hypothetical protein